MTLKVGDLVFRGRKWMQDLRATSEVPMTPDGWRVISIDRKRQVARLRHNIVAFDLATVPLSEIVVDGNIPYEYTVPKRFR